MKGFRCVGRITRDGAAARIPADLACSDDDVVSFSPNESGVPMRMGAIRGRDARGMWQHEFMWHIPTGCAGDYIFVATAVGEHAFDRPNSWPTDHESDCDAVTTGDATKCTCPMGNL